MLNNNGGSGNLKGQTTHSKQAGRSGIDFNLTQPIQLPNGGNSNHASSSRPGNFVQTQPGLQKILRQLNKQSAAAAAVVLLQNSNTEKQTSAGTSSTKNINSSQPRKSSSNKSRRADMTLNAGPPAGSQSQTNSKSGGSTLLNNASSIQSQDAGSTKGRNLLKGSFGEKKAERSSRNPRHLDGMALLPPPSQSNTNPAMPNSTNTFFNSNSTQPIGPTMGTESGGGHVLNKPVTRSASGKRIQRSVEGQQPNASVKLQQQNKLSSTSVPLGLQMPSESRFAQRPQKTATQVLYTEPVAGGVPTTTNTVVPVLHTEPTLVSNPTTSGSGQPAAKYFSQRIQNQLRSKADSEKQMSGAAVASRSSKDELLRAFIKPASNSDLAKTLDASEDDLKQKPQIFDFSNDGNSLKARLAKRSSNKGQGDSNEPGGALGQTLEKPNATKVKPSVSQITNDSDENLISTATKNSLSQAASSFRAKLLRQQESLGGANSLPNKLNAAGRIKDEPQIIQNALNTLKKSLNKQQKEIQSDQKKRSKAAIRAQKAAEEARRRDEEKNFGPDDIVEYRGMKMTMSQREEYMEMEEEQIQKFRHNYYPAKFASKKNGVVVTYAANTHQGMVRSYNEDRVSIILNIIKPKFKQIDFWPRCSFFAIYDGHGGAQCADFLRDQLHQMIVRDPEFPQNPIKAMQRGFEQAEKSFLEFAHTESNAESGAIQRSGSCAIVVLIVGDVAYVANVGDSRAFMSIDEGTKIVQLSVDHKPENQAETQRIEQNGGKVYQNQSFIPDPSPGNSSGSQTLIGPHRVFPGRLSVSRTIGDIEAKDVRYGGNPNVVVAVPEIRAFKIKENYDFITIGCDGVFEKMENQAVMDQVWEAALQPENLKQPMTMHARCGTSVDAVLNECVNQKTLDNITCVIIGFNNFEKLIDRARTTGGCNEKIRDTDLIADNVELDWELEQALIEESDGNKFISKLMKPLEPVVEEMIENSELETPLSEVIEVTRKRIGSKTKANDEPLESHTSSVSDKFADSSRRQSQLLESQHTQNLIDHDLPPIILKPEGYPQLYRDISNGAMVDQSQKSPVEDQQAGIDQRKSATQIGFSEQTQQDSNTELATGAGSEQGLTMKSNIVQKDYKIRQTSASPARVQRQNSDKTFRRGADASSLVSNAFTGQSEANQVQLAPTYNTNSNTSQISIPYGMMGTASSSIPVTKTAKTPNHPNNKASSTLPTSSTLTQGSMRPITPKRVLAQPQAKGPALPVSSAKQNEGQTLRNSFQEFAPMATSTAQSTGKTNRNSARRRDDLRNNNEELSAKPNKKMVANWIESGGPTPGGTQANNPGLNSSYLTTPTINTSFQTGPNTAKNLANQSKAYINTSSITSKSVNAASSKPTRQQRVNETIKNLVNSTHNGLSRGEPFDSMKEQASDLQSQFNTFNGHQIKQALVLEQAKSSSNPPARQQRKKSGGKPSSLTNNNLRQPSISGSTNPQSMSNRQAELQTDTSQGSIGGLNYNTAGQSSLIKQQRSSASRNKPSYLQAVLGNVANSQSYAGQQLGATTNISLNMNQINLQTQAVRLSHHPQISQGQIPSSAGLGQLATSGGPNNSQGGGKQWYSNTINLAGIKQLSNSLLNKPLQQQQQQQQQLSNAAQVPAAQKSGNVLIKRLRDQS